LVPLIFGGDTEMPRPCLICSSATKSAKAAELIASGLPDQAVADALNALTPQSQPMSFMAVSRHRRAHILKPAQDRLAVISKGSATRIEREQLAAAASADAPTPQEFADAYLGLKAQVEKLQRIEERLERMASMAEVGESPAGVAQLAAQQLRSVEVGSKLAGVGGYAPGKGAGDGAPTRAFVVNINFPDWTETTAAIIDGTPVRPDPSCAGEDDEPSFLPP
jgi:hypothetical protein